MEENPKSSGNIKMYVQLIILRTYSKLEGNCGGDLPLVLLAHAPTWCGVVCHESAYKNVYDQTGKVPKILDNVNECEIGRSLISMMAILSTIIEHMVLSMIWRPRVEVMTLTNKSKVFVIPLDMKLRIRAVKSVWLDGKPRKRNHTDSLDTGLLLTSWVNYQILILQTRIIFTGISL